jgi:hypothetical protein
MIRRQARSFLLKQAQYLGRCGAAMDRNFALKLLVVVEEEEEEDAVE